MHGVPYRLLPVFASFFLIFDGLMAQPLTSYVHPMVGTAAHGHTFPGATLPFGMVQLSPDTRVDGSWDGSSGYHYSDSLIYGFSHTHLSGTGVSDYGDILLQPQTGTPHFEKELYRAAFSHADESAAAGFYRVKYRNGILAELTTTTRAGFHRYTFPAGKASVLLDLTHRDELLEGRITVVDDRTVAVTRRSRAWAQDQPAYARIVFDRPFKVTFNPEKTKAVFHFGTDVKNPLLIKVGFAFTDEAGAARNLAAEIPHWDFEKVRRDATAAWEKELSKIRITDPSDEKKKVFYTALYHTMLQPNTASDVDGRYRGRDQKLHTANGFTYYTVFSLWDTFRAAHPLYTLIDQKRTTDFLRTFLAQFDQAGRLPMWEFACNETDCMIGYHSVSVVADALAKKAAPGLTKDEQERLFDAMKTTAKVHAYGADLYRKNGYLTVDDEHESVSKTLEYAYDDWAIAQPFLNNGYPDKDYSMWFLQFHDSWKNLFDPETGFMRPKRNGTWLEPFDPREVNNHFTEGNSWQYSFFVPHDVPGLIKAHGGPKRFEAKLDGLFSADSKTTGREQVDITGLIGQYAHGNEPSHHIAYLYHWVGKPEKSAALVHRILSEFYTSQPDGLIGNEDCGQMSAWYVLSALGLYQVAPGDPKFVLSAPFIEKAEIALENGKTLTISTEGLKPGALWMKSIRRNGKIVPQKPSILFTDMMKGGSLQVALDTHRPENYRMEPVGSPSTAELLFPPLIQARSTVFSDSMLVTLKAYNGASIRYLIDQDSADWEAWESAPVYSVPFFISKNTSIQAKSYFGNGDAFKSYSRTSKARYYKKPNRYTVSLQSIYNRQYDAGGPDGLVDGLRGTTNWRKGDWQGYQNQDFEAVIHLNEEKTVQTIRAGFLQDARSWIWMPVDVETWTSMDGKTWVPAVTMRHDVSDRDMSVQTLELSGTLKAPVKARFVKIKARNYGKIPAWHPGAGFDAFIFVDEVTIE